MPTPIPGTMVTTTELFARRPQYTNATDTTCYKPILESDSAAEGVQSDIEANSDVKGPKECACFCGQHSKLKNYQRSKSVDPDFKYLQQGHCNECAKNATETAVRLKTYKHGGKHGVHDFPKTVTYYETDETDSSFQENDKCAANENDEDEVCPGQLGPTKQFDESASPLVDKIIKTSPRRRQKCRCIKWKCAVVGICLAILFIAVGVITYIQTNRDKTEKSKHSSLKYTKVNLSGNTTTVSSIPDQRNCESLTMLLDYSQFQKDPVKENHQYVLPWEYNTDNGHSIYGYSKEKRTLMVTRPGRYTVGIVVHLDSLSWLPSKDKDKIFNVQMCFIISDSNKPRECKKTTITARFILHAEITTIVQLTPDQSMKVELTADDKQIVHDDENVSKFTITSNDCK